MSKDIIGYSNTQDKFPGQWSPASLNPLVWYDASDAGTLWEDVAGTIPATTSVARWDDKSSNGDNLLQASAGNQPSIAAANINGLDVLTFDGNDYLSHTFSPDPNMDPVMWVAVYALDTQVDFATIVRRATDNMNVRMAGPAQEWRDPSNGANNADFSFSTGNTFVNGVDTPACNQDGTVYITAWLKGAPLLDDYDQIFIGGNGGGRTMNGRIAEIIAVPVNASNTATRQRLEGYLAHKWGLAGNLPANHPYRNYPEYFGFAPKLWTPAEIATIGWYDASDASTITETAGQVTQWDDKSGNDYHLTQLGGNTPEWGLGAQINGLNAMDYAGTSDQLFKDSIPDINLTQFAHIGIIQGANGDWPAVGALFKTDSTDKLDHRHQSNPSDGRLAAAFTLDSVLTPHSTPNDVSLREGIPIVSSFWYDGSVSVNRADGGAITDQQDPADGGTFTINKIQVGRESNTPRNYQGELVILDTADLATIEKVEGYLAWKWGAVGKLPNTHPYKTKAPVV